MPVTDFSISYNDEHRGDLIEAALRGYGVAVVTDVFSEALCNQLMTETVANMKKISPAVKTDSLAALQKTWVPHNLMPQTRPGMFQRGYSFMSWPVRSSEKVGTLFKDAYSRLRGHPVEETITSIDGINIRPPIGPFANLNDADWAHLDQTESGNPFECIQGQAVLTNTTAGFKCSPKSHLVFNEILEAYGQTGMRGNFLKFSQDAYPDLQKRLASVGGEWQIPIIAPRGSFIFWLSSTIHSAKVADLSSAIKRINPEDPWDQWRGVFYVCHRPMAEATEAHRASVANAYKENRTTNHWGTKTFPNSPGGRYEKDYAAHLLPHIQTPASLYSVPGLEKPTGPEIMKLIGL